MTKLKGLLKRLSLSFALLIALLGSGVTVFESCHTQIGSQINTVVGKVFHSHSEGSHAHTAPTSKSDPIDTSFGVCFAIGFVALLLLRFFRLKLQVFRVKSVELLKMKIANFQRITGNFLNLDHIQLGIIRI